MSDDKIGTDLQPAAPEQPVDILGTEAAEAEYVTANPVTKRDRTVSQEMRIQASMHSGPLPPPEMLAAYDKVLPGLAERIVNRFERQSDHRMKLESTVIASDSFSQKIGTLAGSTLGILAVAGGVFLPI